jgi:hypothetical protein
MELDFSAIDNDLNKLPRSKTNSLDLAEAVNKDATVEGTNAVTWR